ncbi:hypothetical protein Vau01_007280 [Virgisporangium aurantiacum]|uniref:Uncharacterized protein n=1 Tax=Virgisporangium aurantiacum TaxID=175570 RepID=A0A8J3YZ54_9ACTN|nr:hypothetical protein Vau01_007280 [Virgisporangium aurantiacum]
MAKSSIKRVESDDAEGVVTSPPVPPSVRSGIGGGSQLTRTTVNLTPRAVAALQRMTGDGGLGLTKTEAINRGIQLLEMIEPMLKRNEGRLTFVEKDGSTQTIWVL